MKLFTVKKEGPNKGRKFHKCLYCDKFIWDQTEYDNRNFKKTCCDRCGRSDCTISQCKANKDIHGNQIPAGVKPRINIRFV